MTAFIARTTGLLGALAAIAVLVSFVLVPELPGLRTLALTAVVGIGGWLYLDWPAISRAAAARGGMEAARAVLLIAVAVGIAVVSVALAERSQQRWDLTPQGSHSVTERTTEVLASLALPPTEVVGFFVHGDDPVASRHRRSWDALAEAFAAAGPTLRVDTIDPDVSVLRAQQAGVSSNGVVIISRSGRSERIYAPDEASLLSAIVRVSQERDRTVYVSSGFGERRLDEVSSESLSELRRELGALGLRVAPLDIARNPLPDDAAAVLVVAPAIPLSAGVVSKLEGFLADGGALFVASEPQKETGLDTLLADGGLGLAPGLVVDPLVRSVTGDASTPMIARYGLHAAVRGLRAPAVFSGARAVVETPHQPTDCTVHRLASTSELAWSELRPSSEPLLFGEGDLPGPLSLLSLSELHPGGRSGGTVILSGDADWLSNRGLENAANRDLAVRVLGSLASQEDLIALPPRERDEGTLAMDWLDQVLVGVLALLFVPGTCLAIALTLWIRRRGR